MPYPPEIVNSLSLNYWPADRFFVRFFQNLLTFFSFKLH
jgi:hypothetical protein